MGTLGQVIGEIVSFDSLKGRSLPSKAVTQEKLGRARRLVSTGCSWLVVVTFKEKT